MTEMYNRKGFIISKGDYYIFNPNDVNIESSIYDKMFDFTFDVNDLTYDTFISKSKGDTSKIQKEKVKEIKEKGKAKLVTTATTPQQKLSKEDKDYNNTIKERFKIYGSYRSFKTITQEHPDGVIDNKFRIVDQRTMSDKIQDKRKFLTGQECKTMKKNKLLDIVMYIKENETGIDNNILDVTENITVDNLCSNIKLFLEKNDRIIR